MGPRGNIVDGDDASRYYKDLRSTVQQQRAPTEKKKKKKKKKKPKQQDDSLLDATPANKTSSNKNKPSVYECVSGSAQANNEMSGKAARLKKKKNKSKDQQDIMLSAFLGSDSAAPMSRPVPIMGSKRKDKQESGNIRYAKNKRSKFLPTIAEEESAIVQQDKKRPSRKGLKETFRTRRAAAINGATPSVSQFEIADSVRPEALCMQYALQGDMKDQWSSSYVQSSRAEFENLKLRTNVVVQARIEAEVIKGLLQNKSVAKEGKCGSIVLWLVWKSVKAVLKQMFFAE